MRITSLTAQNFLSFDQLTMPDLDSTLNVIVGPNGSGKTNVVRVLELIGKALKMASGDQDASQELRTWVRAQRLGSQEPGFTVRIGLELTEEWEKQLLSTFIAATLTWKLIDMQSRAVNIPDGGIEPYIQWIYNQVTWEKFESLFKGELEVRCSGEPETRWEIEYKFDHAGRKYRWMIQSRSAPDSVITLDNAKEASLTRRSSFEEILEHYGNNYEVMLSTSFDFGYILPNTKEKGVLFIVHPVPLGPLPELLRHFCERAGVNLLVSGRYHTVSIVFNCLLQRNLLITRDLRVPPREAFFIDNLALPPDSIDLSDGANIPLYLFRLKNGSSEERATYAKIQETFNTLTNLKIDLHAEPVREKRGQEGDLAFRLQPVVAHEKGDIPIQFSGAGVWEALILSTFLAAPEGRILVLDEPALNLLQPSSGGC